MTMGAPAVAGADVKAHAASKRGDIRKLQRKVGVTADGVFGPGDRARRQALAAPARARGRRHRGTADALRDGTRRRADPEAAPRGSGTAARGRDRHHRSHRGGGVRSLQRVLGVPADGVFGPAHRGRGQALAAPPRPGGRRRRRARRRAAPWASAHGPTLKRRGGGRRRGGGGGGAAAWLASIRGREPDRHDALQVRRRARHLPRLAATTAPARSPTRCTTRASCGRRSTRPAS